MSDLRTEIEQVIEKWEGGYGWNNDATGAFVAAAEELSALLAAHPAPQEREACEGCGKPLNDREQTYITLDDVWLCRQCYEAVPPRVAVPPVGDGRPPTALTNGVFGFQIKTVPDAEQER